MTEPTVFSQESRQTAQRILAEDGPVDLGAALVAIGECADRGDLPGAFLVMASLTKGREANIVDFARFARTNRDNPAYSSTLAWLRDTLLGPKPCTRAETAAWQKDAHAWVADQVN